MSVQLTFDRVPRSRTSDRRTSNESGRRAGGVAAEHIRVILGVMKRFGGDWTAHEIAERTGLSAVQVCRRFAEMRRRGLIDDTVNERPTPSGRKAQCYEVIHN